MSTTGGGGDRKWTTPVAPGGRRQWAHGGVDIIGTHTGRGARYNIANPKPGYVYAWGAVDGSQKLIDEMNGYEPVIDGDTDHPATNLVEESTNRPTQLDTSGADLYGGLRPLRIHEDILAARLADNARLSLEAISQGPDQSFLQGATEQELAIGQSRFALKGHATQVRHGDEVVSQFTPSGRR